MIEDARGRGRTAELRIDVLGPLRVFLDGTPVDPGPRMLRALLTVLAVDASRVVSVERLIDDLWGEQPPPAAIATLQSYVSQLRRILEPGRAARMPPSLLVTVDPGYVLRIEPAAVDLFRFQQLATEGSQALAVGDLVAADAALAAAVALWRGDALAEFAGEAWANRLTVRLREALAVAVEDRVELSLAVGRHAAAVGDIEALVAAEPLRERRWAQLLLALYRAGRQADALRAYQRCRAALADELGIDPGPDLRRLEQAILEQDASLDWVPPMTPMTPLPPLPPLPLPPETPLPALPAVPEAPAVTSSAPAARSAPAAVHPPTGGTTAVASAGPMLARGPQLARIAARLAGGRDTGGALVLVGEPGVGKTTLAEAATALAAEHGRLTAWARCVEDGSGPAYLPWIQLLRGLDPAGGPALREALALLTGVRSTSENEDTARFLTYQSVLAAVEATSAVQPIFLVLDDVHAADAASLALLRLLAGDLHRLRVLFIVTARDTEPSAVADQLLADLVGNRGVERIAVQGLDAADVSRYVELTWSERPAADLVAALHERTGGNPFYLAELVRLLRGEHRRELDPADVSALDVPAGVRDVLACRVDRLPGDTRSLLRLAAVIGRDVDLDVLQAAAGTDIEKLMLALEPAVAAGLLVDDPRSWGYRFRHALVRDSIDAGLGRVERARSHARIARAIEGTTVGSDDVRLTRLARHYALAGPLGDLAKAVRYCREAAEVSARTGAWSEAAALLDTAVQVLGQSTVPAPDDDVRSTRIALLLDLGRARRSAGDVNGSHHALLQAIRLAGEAGDDGAVAEAVALFGQVAPWGSRRYGDHDPSVIAVLERQLDRLRDGADRSLRARLLATVGTELYYTDRRDDGEHFSLEAIELAREIGDADLLGQVLTNYWTAANTPGRMAQASAANRETLALAGHGLPARTELTARLQHLGVLARAGDMTGYRAELARCRALAAGQHSEEFHAMVGWADTSLAIFDARWADAEHLTAQAYAHMRRTSAPNADWAPVASRVVVAFGRGDLRAVADELRPKVDDPEFWMFRAAVVLGDVQAGRAAQARELAATWSAEMTKDWTWMMAIAHWVPAAIRIEVPDPEWLIDELTPFSGDVAIMGIALDCGGAVDSLLAGLHHRLGHSSEALGLARRGLQLERQAGLRAWIPRSSALVSELAALRAHR